MRQVASIDMRCGSDVSSFRAAKLFAQSAWYWWGRTGDGQGQVPAPGGWNRIRIEVEDLSAIVEKLQRAGCRLRNETVIGKGGKQVLVDDPSGNSVELFEQA